MELSRSNTKLREQADALRKMLQKTEQQFRSLLEAAPDAMVQTELLFNTHRNQLMSTNIRKLMPGWKYEFRPGWGEEFEASGVQPVERGIELEALPYNREPFQAECSFSPLETEDGVVVTCSIRDISARKRTEERIRELSTNLEERVLERTEALLRSNEELQQFAYGIGIEPQYSEKIFSIFRCLAPRDKTFPVAASASRSAAKS